MAEEQQPEEGTAEALAQELKRVPSDKAVAVAPNISKAFDDFALKVYPHVLPNSRQYDEMKMIWHLAMLQFLDLLCEIPLLSEYDEDLGAEILQCWSNQADLFLEGYQKRRDVREGK